MYSVAADACTEALHCAVLLLLLLLAGGSAVQFADIYHLATPGLT